MSLLRAESHRASDSAQMLQASLPQHSAGQNQVSGQLEVGGRAGPVQGVNTGRGSSSLETRSRLSILSSPSVSLVLVSRTLCPSASSLLMVIQSSSSGCFARHQYLLQDMTMSRYLLSTC